MSDFDVILAGGGLANGLIALELKQRRPDLRLAVFEAGATLGGNHTWSFHGSDVTETDHALLAPMIRKSWAAQDVIFPRYSRTLSTPYHSMTSRRFHNHVLERIGRHAIRLNETIKEVSASRITLAGGQTVSAPCIIDGRGWPASRTHDLALAYQKFVGLEVRTHQPHGLERPVIMDATVAQKDDFRFTYCLPFSEKGLLVEDTYYAETPDLDRSAVVEKLRAYTHRRGWRIAAIDNEEMGCLPIVLAGKSSVFAVRPGDPPYSGLRAGLFHPTTGYSLPDALRVAREIASSKTITSSAIANHVADLRDRLWRERKFYRMLNRLLFIAARGDERRTVMEQFYRRPRGLIERFYAGQTSSLDKLRILSGRPPIAIRTALRALPAQSAQAFICHPQQISKPLPS